MILSVLFWFGILLLIDGSIGLFFLEKWQDKFKSINLSRWVCIEIILSIVLLIIYGLLKISL
jgi:hypothetical protein